MNRFLTPLVCRHVSFDRAGRPIWELEGPLAYWSDRFGLIVAKRGFRTNFCSTPRAPFIFLLAGDRAHAESAIHDLGYTEHGDLTRAQWDEVFLEAMAAPKVLEVQKDMPPWLRAVMYRGVSTFGQSSWDAPTTVWQPSPRSLVTSAREAA